MNLAGKFHRTPFNFQDTKYVLYENKTKTKKEIWDVFPPGNYVW